MVKLVSVILSIAIVACTTSCSKDSKLADFSNVYKADALGNPLGGDTSDGQWKNRNFSQQEMSFFAGLDTASLSNTSKPDTIKVSRGYPNPFLNDFGISTAATAGFNGQFIFKYVIVNRSMTAIQKGTIRLTSNPYSGLHISSDAAAGRYRVYFTLSAAGHDHFYKSWGNIEKN